MNARMPLASVRLTSSDFARVYKLGRRARAAGVTVVLHENGLGHTRMGLSVSKRYASRAVQRNRARRLLREAFRLERAALPPGLDLVLIADPGGGPFALASLRAELPRLVARAQQKKPRTPPPPVAP